MKDSTNTIMTSEPLSRYHHLPQQQQQRQLHNNVATSHHLPHHHQQIVRIGCYDVIKNLGKGNFAVVKLARHMITKMEVAIKIIDKTRLDETNLKKIYREIQILKLLRHQHIIELYQVIETSTMIYLVLEYASQGEVYDLICNVERLQEQEARKIFYQALTAIEFCHKNNVVHRDLKAENLLLDVNGDVKLADFGFGNFYQPGKMLDTWCGSPPYAAPEVFEGKLYEGPHPDIWSLGVVLYVLVCGTFPFDGSSISTLKDRVLTGRFRIPYWMSEDCENLIRRMLVVNTKKRITINQIKKHRWLQSIVKEKQREVEVAMMTGGRSSTPQPNDLNEQVMKIMQNMDFDRQKVLESVRVSSYDHNYATYHLLKKRLKKELATSGRPLSFEASKLTHQSFKRRPSNIAEHALIKLSGSLKPAVPVLPTSAAVLPLTTVNHRQIPVSSNTTAVQPLPVGYVQAAGALHMTEQQRLPEPADMTSELQQLEQIYQPQTLPFYNGQQVDQAAVHRQSMYHDHQHHQHHQQQQQQQQQLNNFLHMAAPQAEVATTEDVLTPANFHDEGVELNEPPLLPPLHSSEQLPNHHQLPSVHQSSSHNGSLIHRRHTFVIPDMTSYAFPVTPDVNCGEHMSEAVTEALRRSSGFSEETFTAFPSHNPANTSQFPSPLHEYEMSMMAGSNDKQPQSTTRFDASQFPKSSQTTRSSPIDDDDDDRSAFDVTMSNHHHHHRIIHPRPTTEFRCGRRASDGLLLNFGENNLLGEKLKRLTRANGFLAITQEETSTTGGGIEQQNSSSVIGSNCNPLQTNNNLRQTPLFASHFAAHQQALQQRHQILPTSSSSSDSTTNHGTGCSFSKPHRAHVIPVSSSSRRRSVHAPYFVPRSGCASPHDRDSPKVGSVSCDSTLEQLEQLSQQVSRVLFDSNDMDQFLTAPVRPPPPAPVPVVVAAQTAAQVGHQPAVMDMFSDQSLLVDTHNGSLVPSSVQYAVTTALELTSSDEAMAPLHHIDLFNRGAAASNSMGLFHHQLQQRRMMEHRIKTVPQQQHIQQPQQQQYHLPLIELQHLRIDPDLKILPLGGVEEADDTSRECGASNAGWLPYNGTAEYNHQGANSFQQPHMEYGY